MAIYWLMFLLAAVPAALPFALKRSQSFALLAMLLLLFALLVGSRDQVGGDWDPYLQLFDYYATARTLADFTQGDIAYYGLGWLIAQAGGDIHGLNALCAALLMSGLYRLCVLQPRPWLALAVATPYLVIVVGMGYTRQAAAIGLCLWALAALQQQSIRRFVLLVLCAALFHKTAVLLLPLAVLYSHAKGRVKVFLMVAVTGFAAYNALLADVDALLFYNYVISDYALVSHGGLFRALQAAVPAAMLLFWARRLGVHGREQSYWQVLAWGAIALLPFAYFFPTPADRLGLYLLPMQIIALARLPSLASTAGGQWLLIGGICLYQAALLGIWLNFAENAHAWLPYGSVLW